MKKKDLKELLRIQETIPEDLKSRLFINRAVTPTISKVMKLAMKDPDMTEEKRQQMQTLKDSGMLDQKEKVVNKTVEKKIDAYLTEEMNKSIKAGRLTPPSESELKGKYLKKCKKKM